MKGIDRLIEQYEEHDEEYQELVDFAQNNDVDAKWIEKFKQAYELKQIYLQNIIDNMLAVASKSIEFNLKEIEEMYKNFQEDTEVYNNIMNEIKEKI